MLSYQTYLLIRRLLLGLWMALCAFLQQGYGQQSITIRYTFKDAPTAGTQSETIAFRQFSKEGNQSSVAFPETNMLVYQLDDVKLELYAISPQNSILLDNNSPIIFDVEVLKGISQNRKTLRVKKEKGVLSGTRMAFDIEKFGSHKITFQIRKKPFEKKGFQFVDSIFSLSYQIRSFKEEYDLLKTDTDPISKIEKGVELYTAFSPVLKDSKRPDINDIRTGLKSLKAEIISTHKTLTQSLRVEVKQEGFGDFARLKGYHEFVGIKLKEQSIPDKQLQRLSTEASDLVRSLDSLQWGVLNHDSTALNRYIQQFCEGLTDYACLYRSSADSLLEVLGKPSQDEIIDTLPPGGEGEEEEEEENICTNPMNALRYRWNKLKKEFPDLLLTEEKAGKIRALIQALEESGCAASFPNLNQIKKLVAEIKGVSVQYQETKVDTLIYLVRVDQGERIHWTGELIEDVPGADSDSYVEVDTAGFSVSRQLLVKILFGRDSSVQIALRASSGDEIRQSLSRKIFQASFTESEDGKSLRVELINGEAPFWVEFEKEGTSRFYRLNSRNSEILKSDFPKFDGTYDVYVWDKSSNKTQKLGEVDFENQSEIPLWAWLLIFLIPVSAILFKRNLDLNSRFV